MKVALIGLGRWGNVLLSELERVVEVKYKCDSKSDLGPVLSDPEIDAVFVATPTATHYDVASRVIEAGKNLFLEKPGTTGMDNLQKLVNKAKEKKVKMAIGYEYPHHPVVQKIKELTKDKKIDFIRLEYQKWGSFKDEIVRNLLCHDISILKFLEVDTGEPKINKVSVVTEADILATRFGDKAMSVINRVNPIKGRTAILKSGDKQYIWKDDELFEIVNETLNPIEIMPRTPVAGEIADFIFAISENREPFCNGEFAVEIYKTIELAQASALR